MATATTTLKRANRSDRSMTVRAGTTGPLGAAVVADGVNFSVFSRRATGIDLLLFDRADAAVPSNVIRLDPIKNRDYHYWHVFVPGLSAGQIYGFRAHG